MPSDDRREWQCPPQAADDKRKLLWLNEHCEEGLIWHKHQRGYTDHRKALDIFSGTQEPEDAPKYRSQLVTSRLKRNTREVVGACANIRPIWGYSSENAAFSESATMVTKSIRAIYLERFLDAGIKRALQWAAATGTGWVRPVYRRAMYGTGRGNLEFLTYGAPSILPTQLPSNNDWQEAYAVTILDELPIAMAHGMFPKFQDRLHPTSSRFWYASEIRTAAKGNLLTRLYNSWRRGTTAHSILSDLYVPIRYTYVIDLALNTTDNMIPMGDIGTSWYYEVPNLGSDIPATFDPSGTPLTFRKADENDARLYPYRRLMISSQEVVLYDGPAFDWHGEFPATPFSLDDWPWEPIGFNLVRDGYAIQQAIDELSRGVLDKHRANMDMSLAYDIDSVTKAEAESFDPMQPRARIGFQGSLSEKPLVPVVPESVLKVDPSVLLFIQGLEQTMDHMHALKEVQNLAKARAGGGITDDVEKMMEAEGPIVRDISRNVERSLTGVGNQCKYHLLQYYDVRRLMEYVGPDGVTKETFDYNPNSLVPSHLPNENPLADSPSGKVQRARWFAGNLKLTILPHSVHELTQMSRKLLLIQLRKAGVQIDSKTIAEACDIDFGPEPRGNNVWERYWNEQEAVLMHMLRAKQLAETLATLGVLPTPAMEGAANPTQTPPQEGRPPSGQQGPTLVQKDGGARSAVSESGP